MALDIQEQLQQAHDLLDLLPPAQLGAVRSLLKVMIDGSDEEGVNQDDLRRLQEGQAWLAEHDGKGVPMEDVLAEYALKVEDFPRR